MLQACKQGEKFSHFCCSLTRNQGGNESLHFFCNHNITFIQEEKKEIKKKKKKDDDEVAKKKSLVVT